MNEEIRISGKITFPETNKFVVKKGKFMKNQLGVVAKQDFLKGQILFAVTGPIKLQHTKYSFAIDLNRNIEPNKDDGTPDFGHYINHSCDPNTIVRIIYDAPTPYINIIARRDLKAGEELTLDYASFEYEVTVDGAVCKCNNPECRGVIHGFKDLPIDVIKKYKKEGLLPEYLLKIKKQKRLTKI